MTKLALNILFFVMIASLSRAQEVLPLYNGQIPGAKATPKTYVENTEVRPNGTLSITKVSVPTLTIFEAPEAISTGTAVIICPGGGYGALAFSHEGIDVAKRLNAIGVTAFVLKYRLPSDEIMVDKTFACLQDAQQAIYLVRKNAKRYHIKSNKLGVLGFSAGGHFASTLLTHYGDVKIDNPEKINLKPDFGVLVYPVISFQESVHAGTKRNLLGDQPSDSLSTYFSANKNVDRQTPPVYFVHAKDDQVVPVANSELMHQALLAANVPSNLLYYEKGGHGFGLTNKTSDVDWFKLMAGWLKTQKFKVSGSF
ncbi:alpha/beta hydrolase [Pedobacter sandarakinus]|uniref:alpha/beta hydrolase n=1 Tax=Pedobacter sandarakinus TaxID=353156 RepID=UPI002246554E|nr:alpha/beta hydrolase [Pedobacter sandarakinus]MCX2573300.1 alpha/beta hydrolase [Pedobacter sandarakinus]